MSVTLTVSDPLKASGQKHTHSVPPSIRRCSVPRPQTGHGHAASKTRRALASVDLAPPFAFAILLSLVSTCVAVWLRARSRVQSRPSRPPAAPPPHLACWRPTSRRREARGCVLASPPSRPPMRARGALAAAHAARRASPLARPAGARAARRWRGTHALAAARRRSSLWLATAASTCARKVAQRERHSSTGVLASSAK